MTIADLRAAIADLPDDMLVVTAKDREGNHFSPLADVGTGVYEPTTTWYGDFISVDDDEPIAAIEPPNALCLWPTN